MGLKNIRCGHFFVFARKDYNAIFASKAFVFCTYALYIIAATVK